MWFEQNATLVNCSASGSPVSAATAGAHQQRLSCLEVVPELARIARAPSTLLQSTNWLIFADADCSSSSGKYRQLQSSLHSSFPKVSGPHAQTISPQANPVLECADGPAQCSVIVVVTRQHLRLTLPSPTTLLRAAVADRCLPAISSLKVVASLPKAARQSHSGLGSFSTLCCTRTTRLSSVLRQHHMQATRHARRMSQRSQTSSARPGTKPGQEGAPAASCNGHGPCTQPHSAGRDSGLCLHSSQDAGCYVHQRSEPAMPVLTPTSGHDSHHMCKHALVYSPDQQRPRFRCQRGRRL